MQDKYLPPQSSIHAALLVASEEVANILDRDPRVSLHMNATRLRMAETEEDIQLYQMHEWREALEAMKAAMRAVVASFAEIKPVRLRDLLRSIF